MAHTGYWIAAGEGATISDKQAHRQRDCPTLRAASDPDRPVSTTRVEREGMALCPECTDLGIDIDPAESAAERDIAGIINLGICPWCESEYENVGSHAAQVHTDEWQAYKEG